MRATDDLTSAIYERLDAVVENKTASLSRWLDEQTRNVVFVGALPGFGDDTRVFLDPAASDADRSAAEARLREVLATVVTQTADAQELMILDLDGTVRLSTVPALEGIVQKDAPYFARGTSHTTVQNVYASDLTGSPTITVASPLFDQNGGGQRVAVLAANLQLERLDRIILETDRPRRDGPDLSRRRRLAVRPRADEHRGRRQTACTRPGSTTRSRATTARGCTRTTAACR